MLPNCVEYTKAIQNPKAAFHGLDDELIESQPVYLANGRDIWLASGGMAVVFKMRLRSGEYRALRCFCAAPDDLQTHFAEVSKYLINHPCADFFVPFQFKQQGIRVNGDVHPILIMHWLEAPSLKEWIEDNLDSKQLLKLAEKFVDFCWLCNSHYIVHGDLHHENIYVVEKAGDLQLKLLDYDTLYFADKQANKIDVANGLPGYQHPLRYQQTYKTKETDYFSQFAIFISLLGLAEDKMRWITYNLQQSDSLLFTQKDFLSPKQSLVFQDLIATPSQFIKDIMHDFATICLSDDINNIYPLNKYKLNFPRIKKEIEYHLWKFHTSKSYLSGEEKNVTEPQQDNSSHVIDSIVVEEVNVDLEKNVDCTNKNVRSSTLKQQVASKLIWCVLFIILLIILFIYFSNL